MANVIEANFAELFGRLTAVERTTVTITGSVQLFDHQLAEAENRTDDLVAEVRTLENRVDSQSAELNDFDDSFEDLRLSVNNAEGQTVVMGEDLLAKLEIANERIVKLEDDVTILKREKIIQDRRIERMEESIIRILTNPPHPPLLRPIPNPNGEGMIGFMMHRLSELEGVMADKSAEEIAKKAKEAVDIVIASCVGEHRDWMESHEGDNGARDASIGMHTRLIQMQTAEIHTLQGELVDSHADLSQRVARLELETTTRTANEGELPRLIGSTRVTMGLFGRGIATRTSPSPFFEVQQAAVRRINNMGTMPDVNANASNMLPYMENPEVVVTSITIPGDEDF